MRTRQPGEPIDAADIPIIDERQDVANAAHAGKLQRVGRDHLTAELRGGGALALRARGEQDDEQQAAGQGPHSKRSFNQAGAAKARPRPTAR